MTRDKTDVRKKDTNLGLAFSALHALGWAGGKRLDADRQSGELSAVADTAVDNKPRPAVACRKRPDLITHQRAAE